MTKKIVKRTDANNETLYFYTHSDAVDVGEGSSTKSLTEVIDDTLHKSPQTLTNAEKTQVYANLGTESFVGDRAVRYDESQVLGSSEKTQALVNLGLNGVDDVPTENSNNVVRSGGVKEAIVSSVSDAVGQVEDNIEAKNISIIGGQNIMCFGDSITEFTYKGKGWCEYLAGLSGANVVRGAFGGSRIVPRGVPMMNPTTENEARACLDIRNLVESWVGKDYEIVDNCVEWLRVNDGRAIYPSIVQNLKDNPVEDIDVVTLLAGTNDFLATSGMNDVVSSSIKEIIALILTANPKIKIYIFTPLVRYWDNKRDEAHWSDNYQRTDGLTLADFKDIIVHAAIEAHTPVCDLYTTIGWNQNNFSNFFLDTDGTHPYKGFEDIAKKIYSFLTSKEGTAFDKVKVDEEIDSKVDKEKGKSLVSNEIIESFSLTDNDSYIQVTTDNDGKVLQGIKKDGSPYFPHHYMIELTKNSDYSELTVDEENKIVEGIRKDGVHEFNVGLSISQIQTKTGIKNNDWLDVVVDNDYKVLEGIRKDGSKHISKFDEETKRLIKDVSGSGLGGNRFNIPLLDSNFVSPFPVEIIGTKGSDDAKYVFELPLDDDAFNIRFEFKITENLLNQNKNATIANLGGKNIVTAVANRLSQRFSNYSVDGESKRMYWPSFSGGISLNGSDTGNVKYNANLGLFAFYVQYIGQSNDVTISNTGSAITISVDGEETTFSFSDYPTVSELYEAIKQMPDIDVSYNELENRNSTELAIFPETKLVSNYYTSINGKADNTDPKVEYVDAAPLFIPYAVSNDWHKVEVVKIGDTIYAVCDGVILTFDSIANKRLTLGGNCGVLFKELEIHVNSSYDAEIVDGFIISSMNPYIIIYEGHGMDKKPSIECDTTGNMNVSADRLQHVYSYLKSKGYVPVSIIDVADYYSGDKKLPKRCFTTIFDDYRFDNVMDLKNRAVFTRLHALCALAIVTESSSIITHDGETIDIDAAAKICRMNGFELISHTRNHRNNSAVKPSLYISELTQDIYSCDMKSVVGNILVFPFGAASMYMYDVMKWLGYRLGINVFSSFTNVNNYNRSKYNLTRYEIGMRTSITSIMTTIR